MHATKVYDGILLYVQKDNLQTKWFEIEYDDKKIQKILKRFQSLHLSLKENSIPEAEAKHDPDKSWLCERCLWKEECWKRED